MALAPLMRRRHIVCKVAGRSSEPFGERIAPSYQGTLRRAQNKLPSSANG